MLGDLSLLWQPSDLVKVQQPIKNVAKMARIATCNVRSIKNK